MFILCAKLIATLITRENVLLEEKHVSLTIMEDEILSVKVQISHACMTNDINRTKRKMSYKVVGRLLLRSYTLLKAVYSLLLIYTS